MKTSQALWLAGLVGAICTALLGETELLSPTAHRYVSVLSLMATAVSGFMLQRPAGMGGEPPAYFVVREGQGTVFQYDKRRFEQMAKNIAEEMPQPLVMEGD